MGSVCNTFFMSGEIKEFKKIYIHAFIQKANFLMICTYDEKGQGMVLLFNIMYRYSVKYFVFWSTNTMLCDPVCDTSSCNGHLRLGHLILVSWS